MPKRRKKKKAKRNYGQDAAVFGMTVVLLACAVSVAFGFFSRSREVTEPLQGFRIEVLNGTGEKGVAQQTAVALMKKGIDVFKVANADNFMYEETVLIARKKETDLERLGETLGCENIIEQLRTDSFVDATLIIGADYEELDFE